MQRSLSTPSIASTALVPVPVPKKLTRNVSVPFSMGQLITDVYVEYQTECTTHTSAYIAGMCSYQHKFPLDVLNSKDEEDEVTRNIAACLATPPDGETTRSYEEEESVKRQVQLILRRRKIFSEKTFVQNPLH